MGSKISINIRIERNEIIKKIICISTTLILSAYGIKNSTPVKYRTVGIVDDKMISVEELSHEFKAKDFLFVNGHIPVEDNIPGTDLDTPYNKIDESFDKFPADKNAKIILNYRSGSMGDTAA